MSQYNGLIGSTRIPGIERDEIQKFDGTRHVVVQRGANFYTVDILTEEGHPVDAATVKANMQAILEAPDDPDAPAIGVLTTAARDAWAAAREGMVQDATNAASLEQVDSALFAVCLEDASPANFNEVNRVMLHGDARNRWLDKSFQLIVAANGKSAVNFEHAWGDGVAVLRYFNEVFQDSVASPVVGNTDAAALDDATNTGLSQLAWNLSAADEVRRKGCVTCVICFVCRILVRPDTTTYIDFK